MPQATDYVIANDTHANVRADINAVFAAAVGMNSGSSAPGTTYAHMLWADTTTTPSIVSIRDAANAAWNQLFTDTGLIRTEDGALASVALGPASDIDTGIHFATAATVTITTAGTARAAFNSTNTTFNAGASDVDFAVGATGLGANSLFVQGSDGFVGLGNGTPSAAMHGTYDAAAIWLHSVAVTSSAGSSLTFRKSRGSHASPAATSSGDVVANITASTYHSSGTAGFVTSGRFRFITDGAESGNTVPTGFAIATMASGGALTDRLVGTSDGLIGIGVTPTVGSGLGQLEVAVTSSIPIAARYAAADAAGAYFAGYKSRGSIASPSAVSSGDIIMALYPNAYQNSAWQVSGLAGFVVDATPSGSVVQTRWQINTNNISGATRLSAANGCYKLLTNNSATTICSLTAAAGANAACSIDYAIEVWDGTNLQSEVGTVRVNVLNKAAAFTTRATETSEQDLNSGTLATTWAVSSANPAVVSVNANSSLTPSAGYPRIVFSIRNLSQQAISLA